MKEALSKSIINELDVLSWEHLERIKSIAKRDEMQRLEKCKSYATKTVRRDDCIVTYYVKNKK